MIDLNSLQMRDVAIVFIVLIVAVLSLAAVMIVLAIKQVRELDIPEDADFFETLQAVPITVPIALDLLDLGLDFLGAPIAWVLLEMMGLGALKMITIIESVIPGTNLIPTMTIAWVFARTMMKDRDTPFRSRMRQEQLSAQGRYPQMTRGGRSRADQFRQMALPPGARTGMAGNRALASGDVVGRSGRRSRRVVTDENDDLVDAEFEDVGYDNAGVSDVDFPGSVRSRGSRRLDEDDFDGDTFPDEDEAWG